MSNKPASAFVVICFGFAFAFAVATVVLSTMGINARPCGIALLGFAIVGGLVYHHE